MKKKKCLVIALILLYILIDKFDKKNVIKFLKNCGDIFDCAELLIETL